MRTINCLFQIVVHKTDSFGDPDRRDVLLSHRRISTNEGSECDVTRRRRSRSLRLLPLLCNHSNSGLFFVCRRLNKADRTEDKGRRSKQNEDDLRDLIEIVHLISIFDAKCLTNFVILSIPRIDIGFVETTRSIERLKVAFLTDKTWKLYKEQIKRKRRPRKRKEEKPEKRRE